MIEIKRCPKCERQFKKRPDGMFCLDCPYCQVPILSPSEEKANKTCIKRYGKRPFLITEQIAFVNEHFEFVTDDWDKTFIRSLLGRTAALTGKQDRQLDRITEQIIAKQMRKRLA